MRGFMFDHYETYVKIIYIVLIDPEIQEKPYTYMDSTSVKRKI